MGVSVSTLLLLKTRMFMNACLVPPADWAQEEFGAITVQDIRHKHRIIQI
ncbi:MAG: hypothetical protein JWM16_4558, partial [Verrucomicrobiales bacterium]|nr:hypothetical protein [Verrucomicrobiales bacterium]